MLEQSESQWLCRIGEPPFVADAFDLWFVAWGYLSCCYCNPNLLFVTQGLKTSIFVILGCHRHTTNGTYHTWHRCLSKHVSCFLAKVELIRCNSLVARVPQISKGEDEVRRNFVGSILMLVGQLLLWPPYPSLSGCSGVCGAWRIVPWWKMGTMTADSGWCLVFHSCDNMLQWISIYWYS